MTCNEKYIAQVIKNDIQNMIFSLHTRYNKNDRYTFEDLLKRYLPDIKISNVKKKNRIKVKKSKYKKQVIPNKIHRCMARCWGGEKSVRYNPITKKWSYGIQCSKYKIPNSNFCKIHHNKHNSVNKLTHGVYNMPPPHPHYNKYKLKIEKRYKIKYSNI